MFPAMKARLLAAALLVWAALSALAPGHAYAQTAPVRAPIVVELYTSQGCWHCARANRFLGTLSREDDILALTFSVDYWDYLGWADTFAEPEYAQRQRAYADALRGRRSTPQLVIAGQRQVSATDWDVARATLDQVRATARAAGAPSVSIQRLRNSSIRAVVGAGTSAGEADVWFIAFEPGPVAVNVLAGENDRRTLWHYNLVRRITRVGGWSGASAYYEQPRCTPECVVIVQAPNGGPILGAASTRRARR
ncbi:hypothetical protein U91I_03221 [alpha proteobacterium U9-1i]|nr:hypothetical protein U91I_03221 [alpha proteobacterium U9-1i]